MTTNKVLDTEQALTLVKKRRQAPEKKIMWAIKKNLERLGFDVTLFAQPFRARQTRGIPDMYVRHRRWKVRLWIEVKAGKNKPNPFQAQWLATEKLCDGQCMIARSTDDVLAELKRIGVPIS